LFIRRETAPIIASDVFKKLGNDENVVAKRLLENSEI
jgi:hypothetical protein